jgi:tRNA-dihydrouridine synthase
MSLTLLSSPLQGFTDFRFRNAQHKHFGGIDTYYAPYIRLNGKLEIKSSYQKDLAPENNKVNELIPQVMTNDATEFLFVADYVKQLGYKELNWNLGCPYPMVTKRCMGSGLIQDWQRIDALLEKVHQESDIIVSMKMRMGYEVSTEILDVFPILDKYPIKNIAIHARIGKQLYKGGVDLDAFERCLPATRHKIYYNGDITSVESFLDRAQRFPSIDHWMIGRGLIADPFLPTMIKSGNHNYPSNRMEQFASFHESLYRSYESALSGSSHVLTKMESFWEYFSTVFPNPHKTYKLIKKAKNAPHYHDAVQRIFSSSFEEENG